MENIEDKKKVGRPKGTKNKDGVKTGRPKGSTKPVEEIRNIRLGFWISQKEKNEIEKLKVAKGLENMSYREIFIKGLTLINKNS